MNTMTHIQTFGISVFSILQAKFPLQDSSFKVLDCSTSGWKAFHTRWWDIHIWDTTVLPSLWQQFEESLFFRSNIWWKVWNQTSGVRAAHRWSRCHIWLECSPLVLWCTVFQRYGLAQVKVGVKIRRGLLRQKEPPPSSSHTLCCRTSSNIRYICQLRTHFHAHTLLTL